MHFASGTRADLGDLPSGDRHRLRIPPLPQPIAVDGDGRAWIHDQRGEAWGWYLHQGFRLAWTPVAEFGVLLHLLGGQGADEGFEEDGLTFTLSREGLRQTIADLTAIEQHWDRAA